jgi:hypothetical protein
MEPQPRPPPGSVERLDLFVSYQGADTEFAAKLSAAVETAEGGKFRVFFAPWNIHPGQNIVAEIDRALARTRYFGLILSPSYLKADWTNAEGSAAVYADPAGRLGRVIPIYHKPCQIPPLLRFRRYVDFAGMSFELALGELVDILSGKRRPRGSLLGRNQREESGDRDVQIVRELLDAAQPDRLADAVYPNIFPVVNRPKNIWSAPTKFRKPGALFSYYGSDRPVPPFILFSNRLFTFTDLSKESQPFLGAIEEYDVASEAWESWIKDREKAKMLCWLLDDCLREKLRGLRLSFTRKGRKYFYDQGVLREQKFKAFQRGGGKNFIFDYTERGGYTAHRAVNLRFILLGPHPYLRLESGWVFKEPSGNLIEGRRRIVLNAKFTSGQRNATNFNEVRFWNWFLAGEDGVLRLSIDTRQTLGVELQPAPIPLDVGVLGDQTNLSPVNAAPDVLFEEENEEDEADDNTLESFGEDKNQ